MKNRRPSGSTSDKESDAQDLAQHHEQSDAFALRNNPSASNLKPPIVQSNSKHRTKPRRSSSVTEPAWTHSTDGGKTSRKELAEIRISAARMGQDVVKDGHSARLRRRLRNLWSLSWLTFSVLALSVLLMCVVWRSFTDLQLDPKGGSMSYMASAFVPFPDFDTEHTPLATKYSLYLYREMGVDEEAKVRGAPILFVPGNAGSYKQSRSLASEAANYYHHVLRENEQAQASGKAPLDFFTVDFNEDFTAFHGQTMLDQAEYLNEAIAFILSLYHDPKRSGRSTDLPDPTSVIIIGHSMGGVVARTMLTMPNYQAKSVNTIITLSAPHARAPISFDSQIVSTYKTTNDYWRRAHQKWGSHNPLWDVTLISIAGGGLDTIVPSDYSSVASLMPNTHGFTVFTSTIPGVWTGMDHLRITWCDELRKVVVHSIFEVLDVRQPSQTTTRIERMRVFKKRFLTGLEDVAEHSLWHEKFVLPTEDRVNEVLPKGERLVLRGLGRQETKKTYLMPVPSQEVLGKKRFTLLSNQQIGSVGDHERLEVLFCSVMPSESGQDESWFSLNTDPNGDDTTAPRLSCHDAADEVVRLPASTLSSHYPFERSPSFSYLQFDLADLYDLQFIAITDKATTSVDDGWLIAEFGSLSNSSALTAMTAKSLLQGASAQDKFSANRPLVVDIKMPALVSSLLAYNLKVNAQKHGNGDALFAPFVRQYITDVHESKFFVNVKEIDINVHGVAPYIPPAMDGKEPGTGLSLQLWSDPTCNDTMTVDLQLDVFGSFGKLWMRYRTMFAAFPLLVVALVLRKQFKFYDEHGVFISFSESLNQCLRASIPVLFLSLTFFSSYLARASYGGVQSAPHWFSNWNTNATETAGDYTKNDLLIGSPDPFFWFLLPFFGIITVGLCIAVNYAGLIVVHLLTFLYACIRMPSSRIDEGRRTPASFAVTSTRQRVITTTVLLGFVSTVIPYQFAYVVLCIVGLATSVRALRVAKDTSSDANYSFFNYSYSITTLMLWILPINLPVLVVWVRNLTVHWLTPFSTHHNILSVMPYILLVETLSTGRMIPRTTTRLRYVTNASLFAAALAAALYGVSYAYLLHQIVNVFCGWLVAIHWTTATLGSSPRPHRYAGSGHSYPGDIKKRP